MSRIGKKPIEIPQNVEVKIENSKAAVKGPKGGLVRQFLPEIKIEKKENQLIVSPARPSKNSKALWGLSRTLLQNMIIGVVEGFSKQLEIIGVGYKAAVKGDVLDLSMGFSHPVEMKIPEGLEVKVEKNIITISGIDKEKVGQFSAKIRAVRKPEPYKGKGIRYVGEKVRRKEGKKAATTAT